MERFLDGWQVGAIVRAQSGSPFSISTPSSILVNEWTMSEVLLRRFIR